MQRLRTITPLLKTRPELIEELEAIVLSATNPDSTEWDEDIDGHHLRGAMDDLRRHRVQIPLDIAETFALAKRPNLPYAGVSAIAAVATPEALELLLSLHQRIKKKNQSIVFDAIEVVASRLNTRIMLKDLSRSRGCLQVLLDSRSLQPACCTRKVDLRDAELGPVEAIAHVDRIDENDCGVPCGRVRCPELSALAATPRLSLQ